MSWKASAWAKDQRLGSPAAKSILMCLADSADADTAECWPSQARLAEDAEVSERTAREWLQRLEEWGLIARKRRTRASGARASDRIVLKLDVRITDGVERCRALKESSAAQGDSACDLPAEFAGRTNRQSDAEPTGNEAQPTGNQFRAIKGEPPIEPTKEPLTKGAQARERGPEEGLGEKEETQSREQLERRFWKLARTHPGSAGMPKKPWLEAWMKLEPEERDRAERRHPAWLALLKAQSKSHVPALSTYFAEKLFDEVADPLAEPDKPAALDARPFGPLWAALVMRELLGEPAPAPGPTSQFLADLIARNDDTGRAERLRRQAAYGWPLVNDWFRRADSRKGFAARPEDEPLAELTEPVPVDSDLMAAWKAEFERRGWPWLPDWGGMRVVYLPKGGPDGLGEFEQALARIGAETDKGNSGNDDGQREAAE